MKNPGNTAEKVNYRLGENIFKSHCNKGLAWRYNERNFKTQL